MVVMDLGPGGGPTSDRLPIPVEDARGRSALDTGVKSVACGQMLKRQQVSDGLDVPPPFDGVMAKDSPDGRTVAKPSRPMAVEVGHYAVSRGDDPDILSTFGHDDEIPAEPKDLAIAPGVDQRGDLRRGGLTVAEYPDRRLSGGVS